MKFTHQCAQPLKHYIRPLMQSFKNRTVWITGASSGIGRETVIQLHAAGAKIIISSRNELDLIELRNQLTPNDNIMVCALDLLQPRSFAAVVAQVYERFGHVDMLFNNAGISQRSSIIETELAVDRKIMDINYFGTVALTKAVLPRMLVGGGGHFAVVSSAVGKFGYGDRSAYSASKHALHGFFETLRIELHKRGIAVTMICPGPIKTDISVHALNGKGEPTGEMNEMQAKGMPVEDCVAEILKGIKLGKKEIVVGDFKTKLGVKISAVFPNLFFKMAAKQDPRGELKL